VKAGLYFRYTTRSLTRGGRRTVLAAFCVGVGVMAIVGLQMAASMVNSSLTANVRQANGGDVSVVSVAVPFPQSELRTFQQLQSSGRITGFTAVREYSSTVIRPGGQGVSATVDAVDPSTFPLVGTVALRPGAEGTFRQLISRPGTMVLSSTIESLLGAKVGSEVRVNLEQAKGPVYWRVGGIAQGSLPAGMDQDLVVSNATLSAAVSRSAQVNYGEVYLTTASSGAASRVARQLSDQLPLATVSTVQQALNSDKKASSQLTQFLSIAGLAALLIGGIGIVNTMQVSLARRRLEIAMLKTTGYRRRDLYLLFGLEAVMLGLVGGVGGAAVGIGLSDAVRVLLEGVANVVINFAISWEIVLAGVAIGVATTCIFALLPIVRLSRVRPAAVLRDTPAEVTAAVLGSSAALLAVVAVLFWLLASAILGSAGLALILVIGTGVALGLLTLIFSQALRLIGHLPVPERFTTAHVLLVTLALLVSVGITTVASLRAVGALLILASLLGYVVVVLPRPAKAVVRMALRNSERTRTRTAATSVALFVGVFAVGLILILGTDIRSDLDSIITQSTTYNVIAVAPGQSAARLVQAAKGLGSTSELSTSAAISSPVAINGRPLSQVVAPLSRSDRSELAFLTSGIQGFAVSSGSLPDVTIKQGRQLRPSDASTSGILVSSALARSPFNLKVGDTITSIDPLAPHAAPVTLQVVGLYTATSAGKRKGISITTTVAPILATQQTATTVAGSNLQQVLELKFPPKRADTAATQLRSADPGAQVVSLADFTLIIDQFLNNAILFLTAIASLALLAGIVIIANSVALALLERRREIGILKAVGQGRGAVLGEVLTETAAVAGLGAAGGMVAIALVLLPLQRLVIKINLGIPTPLALALVVGAILVAVVTAALVAWGPVRVRPLEVLRYE
jgi:putative ABC transport system permease protein